MTDGLDPNRPRPVRALVVFVLHFILLLGVLAVLDRAGAPAWLPAVALGVLAIAIPPVAGVAGATLHLAAFLGGGRRLAAQWNGIGVAASAFTGLFFLGLLGPAMGLGRDGAVFVLAPALGLFLTAILLVPQIAGAGAKSLPEFLAIRYGGPLARLIGASVSIVAMGALVVAELVIAGAIGETAFGFNPALTIWGSVALLLSVLVLGGMRGLTVVQVAFYILVAAGLALPAIAAMAGGENGAGAGFPGLADALAQLAGDPPAKDGAGFVTPFSHPGFDRLNFMALLLSLAAGVAALPHLLLRVRRAANPAEARRGWVYGLAFLLALLCWLPLHAILAAWLSSPSLPAVGLVELARQSAVLSALFAVAAFAAILSSAAALLHGVAMSFSEDIFAALVDRGSTSARRLLILRGTLAFFAVLLGSAAIDAGDAVAIATASLSVIAASFFPALALAAWHPVGARAAIAGMAVGAGVTVIGLVASSSDPAFATAWLGMSAVAPADPSLGVGWFGVRREAEGFFGLVAGFATIVGVTCYPRFAARFLGRSPPKAPDEELSGGSA